MTSEPETPYIRPTWDEYFMEVSRTIAKRATCDRGRSGCVIARNKQILVTGYVGSPVGLPHCDEVGHLFKQVTHEDGKVTNHCVRTVHAEQNAICQAAYHGTRIAGATIYVTISPCLTCAKLIINAGIREVVYGGDYAFTEQTEKLLKAAGVKCRKFVKA